MKHYLGIDLGGSNVRVGVVTREGQVLEEIKRPSLADQGPHVVLDNIIDMTQSLRFLSDCLAVGVGLPGPVDTLKGCMTLSSNIAGFLNFPVAQYLKDRLHLPVYLDNDANVAGLAEAIFGAGKNQPIVYYLTHSTGVGGALIVNEKVVSGRRGYAGEIGNIVIDRDRTPCGPLNAGSIENEGSGSALVRKAQALIDPNINSAQQLFDYAQQGNFLAQDMINTMAYDMAFLLHTIAHLVDPHIFVLGGGVTLSSDFYWKQMIQHYQDLVHTEMQDTPFVKAKLDEPGVIGAAALCFSHEKGQ